MLNINKIESDIHHNNLESTDVCKIIGVKYSTTLDRRKKGNWAPNDIEKLADYFGRTIAYYFDREEKQAPAYKEPEVKMEVVEEYGEKECRGCKELRLFSQLQQGIIDSQEKNLDDLRHHIRTLENTFGTNLANTGSQ